MWIKDVELTKACPQACEDGVTHMDSVSMVTRSSGSKSGSGRSNVSSALSACLKEEAKRAALEAKAAGLKQTALAMSNAKIKIYEEYDAQEKGDIKDEYADTANTPCTPAEKQAENSSPAKTLDVKPPVKSYTFAGARPKLLKADNT